MTTSTPVPTSPTSHGARLETYLREIHNRWLQEVHGTLDPAVRPEAGSWIRWVAVRHIEKKFYPRFEREREVIQTLREDVGGISIGRLWAAAELLILLRWQLDQLASLCHRPDEFATITHKLRTAIEHWCREVEDAIGGLGWPDLPDDVKQALSELDGAKEATHVAHS